MVCCDRTAVGSACRMDRPGLLRMTCVLAAVLVGSATSAADDSVPQPSMWYSPTTPQRPSTPLPDKPGPEFRTHRTVPPGAIPPAEATRGRVALVVEQSLSAPLDAALGVFASDLAADGFSVVRLTVTGGTAADLRGQLQQLYHEADSLVGAVFVGNLPYVVFEQMDDFGSGSVYSDFACDLYFMDMNGSWTDELTKGSVVPGNGKLDMWLGESGLEIWVSRIQAHNLPTLGEQADLAALYFGKNHALRGSVLADNLSALVYVDDDWQALSTDDTACVELLFGSDGREAYADPETTTGDDYRTYRMPGTFHLCMLRSHGSSDGHGFYRNQRGSFDWVPRSTYPARDPRAMFYSLYVCSGCDYVRADCLGGTIVMNPEGSALLAWGSTKTGGMCLDRVLYERLAAGECFGKAFVGWFNSVRHLSWAPEYFNGMVMLGDATLARSAETLSTVAVAGRVVSNGGGVSGVVLAGLPGEPTTDGLGLFAADVPLGWSGTITPSKQGYTFTPSQVTSTVWTPQMIASFRAEQLPGTLSVRTRDESGELVQGEIHVNGTFRGTSAWSGQLAAGTVRVSFGEVAGHLTPAEQEVQLEPGLTTSVTGTYVPGLTVSATAEPSSIVGGQTALLSAVAAGGSSPYTYLWGDGQTGAEVAVAPSETTTYEVTVTDGVGRTATRSVTVEVNQIAAAVVGGGPACFAPPLVAMVLVVAIGALLTRQRLAR